MHASFQSAPLWFTSSFIIALWCMLIHYSSPPTLFLPRWDLSHAPASCATSFACLLHTGAWQEVTSVLSFWSHTNHAFYQKCVTFIRFMTKLICVMRSDITTGSLNVCCPWTELKAKAPQEAQSETQKPQSKTEKPISVKLRVTWLKFMYWQMVFSAVWRPWADSLSSVGFTALQKEWATGRRSEATSRSFANPWRLPQQSNCPRSVNYLCILPQDEPHDKFTPLFSTWKRKSPVFTGNTSLIQAISWFCYEFVNIGNCSFNLQE